MRHMLCLSFVLIFMKGVSPAAAAEKVPEETTWQLRLLESAVDALTRTEIDVLPEQRTGSAESLNQAFVALTGEAVNPLFGITMLGMYNYFRTPEGLRDSLPIYDRPEVWAPLLVIILLMLFNSTICEAIPFLKVPLNALGDIVNKAGAIAVLPLVIKMFADSVAPQAGAVLSAAAGAVFPIAHAGGGAASVLWHTFGWVAGAAAGFFIYSAVWLTFNVVDVLILLCPFPGVDALLKSFRLSVMGVLAGSYQFSPAIATLLSVVVVAVSFFMAGWSFRLSVFGLIFSSDIIFFRRGRISETGTPAFSSSGMAGGLKLPVRTYGRLEKGAEGNLLFAYCPWLVMGKREIVLGPPSGYSSGRGLMSVFLMEKGKRDAPWLRLPPRYRGAEGAMADVFGLSGVVDCGAGGSLRTWLSGVFGQAEKNA